MIDDACQKAKDLRLKTIGNQLPQVIEMAGKNNWPPLKTIDHLFELGSKPADETASRCGSVNPNSPRNSPSISLTSAITAHVKNTKPASSTYCPWGFWKTRWTSF